MVLTNSGKTKGDKKIQKLLFLIYFPKKGTFFQESASFCEPITLVMNSLIVHYTENDPLKRSIRFGSSINEVAASTTDVSSSLVTSSSSIEIS